MSFLALYEAVQLLDGKISTRWLRNKALELSAIARVKEQWTGVLDSKYIRGFYIEGPLAPPVPLEQNESLIVLARGCGKHMRRFVYTKELMHVFDTDEEKADTADKFSAQAEKFSDPEVALSPAYRAEVKAFWRALAVLCQETRRREYQQALIDGRISLEVVATALQIPSQYARNMFREDFLAIVGHVKG
jgi:hypothetical protein